MNLITLQPGEIRQIPLTGRFLVVRTLTGKVVLSDPHLGLPEFEIKQSDNLEFEQSRSVTVRNAGDAAAQVELQSSPVKIFSNDGGSVKISGGSIQSIIEPIQVTAEATVQNGTVTSQSPNATSQLPDVTIPAGATVTVINASGSQRRVVFLQNISDTETLLRVGGTPTANAGAVLKGGIDAIASIEFESVQTIKVYNASANDAKVAIMWSSR